MLDSHSNKPFHFPPVPLIYTLLLLNLSIQIFFYLQSLILDLINIFYLFIFFLIFFIFSNFLNVTCFILLYVAFCDANGVCDGGDDVGKWRVIVKMKK
jgi:hypothetical protein